jgi:hypothetical protein
MLQLWIRLTSEKRVEAYKSRFGLDAVSTHSRKPIVQEARRV